VKVWLFSSRNIDNIEVAYKRLLWGFWDREAGDKQRRNWRAFIRLYNQIKPFDSATFQIAGTGEIHAIGLIKGRHYDDQTPIWPAEVKENKVLFPWRVEFSIIIFTSKPILTHFIKIENYIDGYGIGEVSHHDFNLIKEAFEEKFKLKLGIQ